MITNAAKVANGFMGCVGRPFLESKMMKMMRMMRMMKMKKMKKMMKIKMKMKMLPRLPTGLWGVLDNHF